ncbi:unnamed protein product [Calypogeia fissa]
MMRELSMIIQVGLALVLLLATRLPSTTAIKWKAGVSPNVYILRLKGESVHQWKSASAGHRESTLDTDNFQMQPEKYTDYLKKSHDSLLMEVLEPNSYEKLYSYTFLLNAVSVKLHQSATQTEKLRSHPKVQFIEQEIVFHKTTTHTPDFLGLPSGAWRIDGGTDHAGENVVIGMLDTGINPSHPSFASMSNNNNDRNSWRSSWRGKCVVADSFPIGSCNDKVVGAQYFDKGIVAANLFNATYDFASPLDGDGHGTHTSSIAAGNNGVPVMVRNYNYGYASGVAPRARLAIYKVIYRDGGFLSDVLAGIDQAVQDGVDVLSISLGSTSGTYGIPSLNTFDIVLLFAVKAGVVVVHAAGNNGPYPLSMNSFGPWVISVAAGLTDRSYSNPIILSNGQRFNGLGLSAGTPGKYLHQLIYAEDAFVNSTSAYDAEYFSYCQDPAHFRATLVKGRILICNFVEYFSGGAAAQFQAALTTAQKLEAVGLLILTESSDGGREKVNSFDPIPFSLPASFVSDTNAAKKILQYYRQATKKDHHGVVYEFGATARLKDSRMASYTMEAPVVSSFSARGPIYSNTVTSVVADVLKPDVMAPGSQIWGAWSPNGIDTNGYNGQSFAMLSGTSMATPHIAGVAALLKQRHPDWDVSTIKSAILTTANQRDSKNRLLRAQQPSTNASTTLGKGTFFDYGFGAVNATAALDPGLVFKTEFQDHINFLCTLPGADPNTVQDATGGTCETQVGARTSDLNVPSITIANLIGSRTVRRVVTNVGLEETYIAKIYNPVGVKVRVRPNILTIKARKTASFKVTIKATSTVQQFTFGSLTWEGSNGHVVFMPLSVSANSVSG